MSAKGNLLPVTFMISRTAAPVGEVITPIFSGQVGIGRFLSSAKIDAVTRFDVCEVYLDDSYTLCGINYIENAFQVMK